MWNCRGRDVDVKPGDILGFSSHSLMGLGINLGTWGVPFWGLSHVGIVVRIGGDGPRVLAESTMTCPAPCEIQSKVVQGVQVHRIADRVRLYRGKVWRYPLARALCPIAERQLWEFTEAYLGASYDAIGAFRSRDTVLGILERHFRPENLMALFCSEFVAAGLRHIGLFPTDKADRWNPNSLCRRLRRIGLYLKPERW